MKSISERTYKWWWGIKAQVQFIHCLPENQELQSWPERTTFNCTSWPLLTWSQIYHRGSWGSTVVHFNLKPSVSLLCVGETVLAKGDDPKMEQVTCLKTEFPPFNSQLTRLKQLQLINNMLFSRYTVNHVCKVLTWDKKS